MPTALTIAGSDSGGGAGIQADLKTFSALGVYGTTAITAITAQNTVGVHRVLELPADLVAAQIEAVLSDIGADAVKTGMLSSGEIIEAVARKLAEHRVKNLVVDTVMKAKDGTTLLPPQAIRALKAKLFPLALVVTPNVPETEVLVGRAMISVSDLQDAAREIVAMGAKTVVIKGGHRPGAAADLFYDGKEFHTFTAPRVDTPHTHGTGCTFAAAIAAHLARGEDVLSAVAQAKEFVTEAIRHGLALGHGQGPVNQLYRNTGQR